MMIDLSYASYANKIINKIIIIKTTEKQFLGDQL